MGDERSEKTSGGNSALVPQPHGGALTPGNPGNKGGGRTPSALRKLALKKGPKMLKVLDTIANDENAKQSDRVAAARELLRVGLSSSMSRDEVREKLHATIMMIESHLDEKQSLPILMELRRIWLA